MTFNWFANRNATFAKACLFGYLSFSSLDIPPTVISHVRSDFRTISSLFSHERYLITVEREIDQVSFSSYTSSLVAHHFLSLQPSPPPATQAPSSYSSPPIPAKSSSSPCFNSDREGSDNKYPKTNISMLICEVDCRRGSLVGCCRIF